MALDRSTELRLAMKVMASMEWEMLIKGFFYFYLWQPFFAERNEAILAISVEGHPRNISVKLF